jgi:cytidylate kinase
MYRAVTLYFLRENIGFDDDAAIKNALEHIHISFKNNRTSKTNETYLNGENVEKEIRSMRVSAIVSEVSAIKAVRHAMVALQRKAGKNKAVVMDGRDIGTNVFPDAELKIFLTADPEVRAQRRYLELIEKNTAETLETVVENLQHRDHIDTTRTENPLRQAPTARIINNTQLTRTQQVELVIQWINELTHNNT